MNFIKFVSLLVLLVACSNAEQFSYEGYMLLNLNFYQLQLANFFHLFSYRLIRLYPKTVEQLNLIGNWENNEDFDVWGRIKNTQETVTVLLSPFAYLKYKVAFENENIVFEVIDENIQK